jgi:hypothetical protein
MKGGRAGGGDGICEERPWLKGYVREFHTPRMWSRSAQEMIGHDIAEKVLRLSEIGPKILLSSFLFESAVTNSQYAEPAWWQTGCDIKDRVGQYSTRERVSQE